VILMRSFVTDTIFKRDIFSETVAGRFEDDADGQRIVFRNIAATPLWSRALARLLARRERRALKAVDGIEGVPRLLAVVREGHYRTWIDGTPLHFSHPGDSQYYRDARRLLRDLRRHGITHNDLAKPQNWLARPDGTAAVIDFQLASIHRRRGLIFRLMAYEDLRHML
jgi:RIO-like serine/threonine protein kinase